MTDARQNSSSKKKSSAAKSYANIRDIARLAGVSTATVSRVINHPEKCSPDTIARVRAIIDEKGYIPNDAVSQIISGSSRTLAVFVFDIHNPFYTQLTQALNRICLRNQYTLLICDTANDPEVEAAYLKSCLAKRCEGLIITEGLTTDLYSNLPMPSVILDRRDDTPGARTIASENYQGVREAVDYLYDLGHRRIGFVGTANDFQSVKMRREAYLDGLAAHGIPVREDYVFSLNLGLTPRLGQAAIRAFHNLPDPPTAVICANDMVALGLMNEAFRLKISVPEDLSVIGFDKIAEDLTSVVITTIRQDIDTLAQAIFDSLVHPTPENCHQTIPTTFVEGQTCGKPRT
ncbi:MAG: LacI family DNA-binding transcriptional regulator [Lachnospiraceae bacterium]|nr:LacI family DNA-binding transcriptional regulator [Lachnospiraceae bacterium]